MIPEFLIRVLLAGLGVALMGGPLGSLMVWRRMANFGDTLAHATLLGICFSVCLELPLYVGIMGICILMAGVWVHLQHRRVSGDTILGIIAHTTLAGGLIIATRVPTVHMDLLSYLYGDILSITWWDLFWIYSAVVFVGLMLFFCWEMWLKVAVSAELAFIEGISVVRAEWALVLTLAVVFALTIKLVGILLMGALFIIPPSIARVGSRSPEQMAVLAVGAGAVAVCFGIIGSVYFDWPTGPAIVLVAALGLLLSNITKAKT